MRTIRGQGEDRRVPMSLRISPAMRDQLVAAAQMTGRSLTQEIELRLEQSFRSGSFVRESLELAFGPFATELMLLLGRKMRSAAEVTNLSIESDWPSDPSAYEYARASAEAIFEWLKPTEERPPSVTDRAKNFAEMTMRDIADAPQSVVGVRPSWMTEARQVLGPERLERGKARWNIRTHGSENPPQPINRRSELKREDPDHAR
jgi:hypothetical protein